jgi:N4-gp56 family major capsid protein
MQYSDISPRTTAYADRRLLERIMPNNIAGQFGQVRTLPRKNTQTMKFRRYNKLAVATTPLVEGITPTGKTLTKTDVTVTLKQYGDWIGITDVIQDTHEDPVLRESIDILGEQAAETIDVLRIGVLKAGTNVQYANGASRAAVNDVFSRDTWRTIARVLMAQEAKTIRTFITAGPNIGTKPVPPCYIVLTHTDALPDLERVVGWKSVEEYPSHMNLVNGELGSVGFFPGPMPVEPLQPTARFQQQGRTPMFIRCFVSVRTRTVLSLLQVKMPYQPTL